MNWKHRALVGMISEISERCYCAGWNGDIEYHLWRMLEDTTAPRQYGLDEVWRWELRDLREISAEIGGWIYYRDDQTVPGLPCAKWGPRFVPMARWRKMYAAWAAKCAAPAITARGA